MSDKVIKLEKKKKSESPPPSMLKRVMIFVFTFLIFIQIFKFYTGPSLLMRKHQIVFYKNPVDISQNVFESLDGKRYSFGNLKGNNIILAFWAPWCGYCKDEIPAMSRLAKSIEQLGYVIVPLTKNIESPESINKFYQGIKKTEPFITGDRELYAKLGVHGVPTYILVNESGNAVGYMKPNWRAGDVLNLFAELKSSTLMLNQDRFPDPSQP
ncbi:MAG: hypothetical protein COV35_03030 [Alphaproteobacteria bacterium CG11_big_fil_rev_8_21_14_0_20_39_49]|nr:MAG: hypothetical protein COV35_03030 [Alphaproteobacteria bacterium CG11_big_fil_rev_8_21_14_0_20_39_49]